MALLTEEITKQLRERFGDLKAPVTLHVFTQELECQFCRENRMLAEEVAGVAPDKISVQVHNFVTDQDAVKEFTIDKIPAIAVVGQKDFGIRFYGVPAGYEFPSLLSAIKLASDGASELSQSSKTKLGAITKPIHLKVFVTLTCPYCPSAVHMAHQLAVVSPLIKADMVEASQFPHLAVREQVMGVPKTVIEGVGSFEGALPEPAFVDKIVEMVTGGTI